MPRIYWTFSISTKGLVCDETNLVREGIAFRSSISLEGCLLGLKSSIEKLRDRPEPSRKEII